MARNVTSLIPTQEIVVDSTNHFRPAWLSFFQNIVTGDVGSSETILPANLAFSGTPTIAFKYFQNSGFIDLYIVITPGTSTTSTYGTTYFPLPFDVLVNDYCVAVTTPTTTPAMGFVDAATNRLYPPAWTAITTPVTIRARLLAA